MRAIVEKRCTPPTAGPETPQPGGDVWVQVIDQPRPAWLLRPGQRCVITGRGAAGLELVGEPSAPRAGQGASGRERPICRLEHRGSHVELLELEPARAVRIGGVSVQRARLPLCGAFELGPAAVGLRPVQPSSADFEPLPAVVGSSPPIRRLTALVRRCASLAVPVLVLGESGTGKDLVARALHGGSAVGGGPLVALNAATLSRELAGSELFGHERGAFTGAEGSRQGAFRRAGGGTLFIDEVAALPRTVQPTLLRAVEEGLVTPLGADRAVQVEVRLITATCEPLDELVRTGQFRPDLYQRLATCVIRVPPLRERRSDIGPLARHLLARSELGPHTLGRGALQLLREYRWPGNVRELRNVLLQAAMRSPGRWIGEDEVASVFEELRPGIRLRRLRPDQAAQLVAETNGNVSEAARRAGMPRSSFRDLLRLARRLSKVDDEGPSCGRCGGSAAAA